MTRWSLLLQTPSSSYTTSWDSTLTTGGYFVISDFPFPESTEECRTVPGRIMSAIQFFEATIDDQLLPVKAYLELLNSHGFKDVDAIELTPVHALTFGRK